MNHLPICEYYVVDFHDVSIGINIQQREAHQRFLGYTLVNTVRDNTVASKAGIQDGDAIIEINTELTSFMSYQDCVQRLKSLQRPLQVTFARALKSQWRRLAEASNATVKVGLLSKTYSRVWNRSALGNKTRSRQVKLTRASLSFYNEMELRREWQVHELLGVEPNAPGFAFEDCAFSVHFRDKGQPLVLVANSHMDRLMWVHAIELVLRGSFDEVEEEEMLPPAYEEYTPEVGDKEDEQEEQGPYAVAKHLCTLLVNGAPPRRKDQEDDFGGMFEKDAELFQAPFAFDWELAQALVEDDSFESSSEEI